jgi:type I restriction enzyme, S subunit
VSRIDELVNELAPNGVPFRELGELGEFIRGNGLQKSDLTAEGAAAIHYGQIHTYYGIWTDRTKSFTAPMLAAKLRRARHGDLIIATTSEDDAAVAKATAWLGEGEVAVSGDAYIYRHILDPRYVAYFFQSEQFQNQKVRLITGTKVRRVSGDALAKIQIPVPPIEVQREIARTLDLFAGLETELRAELGARRYQYQHYSRTILEGYAGAGRDVCIGDVADILVGFPFKSSEFTSDQAATALVRGDNIGQGFLKDGDFKRWKHTPDDSLETYELRAGDIVLAMDRPWIPTALKWARISERTLPALLVQRVARLRSDAKVLDQRFLGCIISSPAFTSYVLQSQTGNTVPHISGGQIEAFPFSLPTLPEQIRITAALDKFDALMNDSSVGLSAELNARRKQYEYYRDQLLTFKDLAAA